MGTWGLQPYNLTQWEIVKNKSKKLIVFLVQSLLDLTGMVWQQPTPTQRSFKSVLCKNKYMGVCETFDYVCVVVFLRVSGVFREHILIYSQTKVRPFPSLNTNIHTVIPNFRARLLSGEAINKLHATLLGQAHPFPWLLLCLYPHQENISLPCSTVFTSL